MAKQQNLAIIGYQHSCSGIFQSAHAGHAALRMPGYAQQMPKPSVTGSNSSLTSFMNTISWKRQSSTWTRQHSCLVRVVLSIFLFLKAIQHLGSKHSQGTERVQQ